MISRSNNRKNPYLPRGYLVGGNEEVVFLGLHLIFVAVFKIHVETHLDDNDIAFIFGKGVGFPGIIL